MPRARPGGPQGLGSGWKADLEGGRGGGREASERPRGPHVWSQIETGGKHWARRTPGESVRVACPGLEGWQWHRGRWARR